MIKISEQTMDLRQSGIRRASTRCAQINGINLGQGICELPVPPLIKEGAFQAIEGDKSLYSPCEGILELRKAVAAKLGAFNHIQTDPNTEIMITHGSTGAFVCAAVTLFNAGDEVIVFEPFYGYHKNILSVFKIGVKTVSLDLKNLTFDIADLRKAISPKTKGIILCTPANPSGKVFTREELLSIAEVVETNNLCVITDEIYEYITYPGYTHISPASIPSLRPRTITISGFSKTYNMTGWRLGYAQGPAEVISKMALVQDLFYVCPSTPLQHAVLNSFLLDESYFQKLRQNYLKKRDFVVSTLRELDMNPTVPQGAYYLMVDISKLPFSSDEEFATFLLEKAKVATVPGRAFFLHPKDGEKYIRICYALNEDKIESAMQNLKGALQ